MADDLYFDYPADPEMQINSTGTLIDSLVSCGYGIMDNFLNNAEIMMMNRYLDDLLAAGNMQKAGIGQGEEFLIRDQIRGDFIHWLNEKNQRIEELLFSARIKALTETLNRELFAGIRDIEMHFAVYPVGTFYRRHLDCFRTDQSRLLTFICYLNEDWQEQHGGELGLYLDSEGTEKVTKIAPVAGRLVIFRSHLIEHEVFVTLKERRSITGWMLNQLKDLKNLIG